MILRVYIISYNDETYNYAFEKYGNFTWAKVIKIETTLLFENIMFDKWLIDNYDDWKQFQYIGFLSWKADTKITLPNFDNIIDILNNDNSYQIIPLFIIDANDITRHPYLYDILNILFDKLLYDNNYVYSNFIKFFCNYWIARKDALIDYIFFIKKCKNIIENDENIQKLIWLDTEYNGSLTKPELIKIFNKPYYCYHPFIYERLPFLYFQKYKYLIL